MATDTVNFGGATVVDQTVKVGTVAGLPVVTTTAGAVTANANLGRIVAIQQGFIPQ
jgi:hypothetical protein